MLYNVGLDLGNNFVKVVSGNTNYSFPAMVKTGFDEFSEAERYHIVYDDVDYSVGIGNYNLLRTKYFSLPYKILFLTALAKITKGNTKTNDYNVVISLPVDEFKNKELRKKIKETVLSWGTEQITVDGVTRNINIQNFAVFCEGSIISIDLDTFKEKDVIIVDIGGYTWDFIGFKNLKKQNSSTENKGIITLKDNLYQNFKNKYFTSLGEEEKEEFFKSVILGTTYMLNGKEIDLKEYRALVENYIIDIFNKINRTFDMNNKEILFIGGGSLELKKYIEKYEKIYNVTILKNADMLNAFSNYNYCVETLNEVEDESK